MPDAQLTVAEVDVVAQRLASRIGRDPQILVLVRQARVMAVMTEGRLRISPWGFNEGGWRVWSEGQALGTGPTPVEAIEAAIAARGKTT